MSTQYKIANPEGLYYLTFATVQWVDIFTRQVYRDIMIDSFRYCQQNKGLELYAYVIMSNHVHIIATSAEGKNLSYIMRDMKKFTSKKIIETMHSENESRKGWMDWVFSSAGRHNPNNENYQFWQQDNHPIELWSTEVIEQKLNYIHENPVRAGWVQEAEHYIYSSAMNYAGKKGLLDVIIL